MKACSFLGVNRDRIFMNDSVAKICILTVLVLKFVIGFDFECWHNNARSTLSRSNIITLIIEERTPLWSTWTEIDELSSCAHEVSAVVTFLQHTSAEYYVGIGNRFDLWSRLRSNPIESACIHKSSMHFICEGPLHRLHNWWFLTHATRIGHSSKFK